MNPTALLIAALAVLPAIGLAVWASFVMAQVEDEMRASTRGKGMLLDDTPAPHAIHRGHVPAPVRTVLGNLIPVAP